MARRLTIVKVMGPGDMVATSQDIERWREIFRQNQMTVDEAAATGEVAIEEWTIPEGEDQNYITLVKVGDDDYKPTFADLEIWRKVFKEAQDDPDFKIFTHPAVDISVINIGNIVAIE